MADLGNDARIRVSTEQLVQVAGDVTNAVSSFGRQWEALAQKVANTSAYWIGSGGDAKRKEFQILKEDVELMIRRLGEYPVDLQKIAGVYVEKENANAETAEGLPADVIV